jgi:methionyl-tRNA formyltransferase
MKPSPIKKFARKQGLPLLQPKNLMDKDFKEALQQWEPDLQVVVAFRMLPESVFALPPGGTINLHASLLPQYRGAAPINWAIINGETKTGVTTFFIEKQIDTGDILFQEESPIYEDDTAGDLHDRLKEQGARLVVKTVNAIREGDCEPQPQPTPEKPLKKAPKIQKSDCEIDWSRPLVEVYNFIRGLSPFPGAWTTIEGDMFRVFEVEKEETTPDYDPGTAVTDGKTYMKVAVPKGYIQLKNVQRAGKRKMKVGAFLQGYRGPNTIRLGE